MAPQARPIAMKKPIRLILIDPAMLTALEIAPQSFEAVHHARLDGVGELARDVARQTLAMVGAVPRDPAWGGYLAIDEDDGAVVGTCGFKTGPGADGSIEIAYFTFPQFERQGYATAMAARLVTMAIASPAVRLVFAHTLAEPNASTRVLEKTGLHFVGEVTDPEDGRVWRWEFSRH